MARQVLITGASQGIGRGIARRLHDDGYSIINLDRMRPASMLDRESFYQVDLSDASRTSEALEAVCVDHQPAALVNNVGAGRTALIEDATLDDLDSVVALHLRCTMQCVQALLPIMKRAGSGRIVNISSRAATGKATRSLYGAAKGAMNSLTRTWALELGRHGITVNAVAPGPIETDFGNSINPAEAPATQRLLAQMPIGRLGTPEDVAHIVASLLDDRAGFTTGQIIYVCGGLSAGVAPA